MIQIARLAKDNPAQIIQAPEHMPVKRLDEVKAARQMNLCWKPPV
jgi:glycine dehydrogenase subunit 2